MLFLESKKIGSDSTFQFDKNTNGLTAGASVTISNAQGQNPLVFAAVPNEGADVQMTYLGVDGEGNVLRTLTTTGADATVYLAKTVTVPADTTLVVLDTPIYLMEGDVLKGGASANSDLDLFVSFEILDDA